jgi:hypothetical protein
MLCLSIRQPWAHLVLLGRKRVENRSWPTAHRGRLAIHAASRLDVGTWDDIRAICGRKCLDGLQLPELAELPRAAIVGTVELVDRVDVDDLPTALRRDPFTGGPVCWLLRDPRPLARPVPCAGRLRLWEAPADLTGLDVS